MERILTFFCYFLIVIGASQGHQNVRTVPGVNPNTYQQSQGGGGHPPPPPPPSQQQFQQNPQFQQPPQGQQQFQQPPQQQQFQQPGQFQQQQGQFQQQGQPQQHQRRVLHREINSEKEHVKEHMEVPIDTSNMSEQELQFHYFKMHDSDGNNKLDGCELVKSLIHWHDESNHDHNSGQAIPEAKIF
ncbi:MCFD2 [Lepeophtheirus salmonis]|uniref:MCFD2 n=1 Tax=Lepeophtheirus salmonis TaxID=72036 RepID=A0A7R8CNF1_LEPSM|nr:MCFD2 [Lepeophtheirus salmonis]CAF2874769.1 MCFD2 [Lepeophtheirus salmonis]